MRVAVISDIHSNLGALRAVLADANTVDETWCLGDIVGYGPKPNECVAEIRQLEPRLLCVVGNHDVAAVDLANAGDFNTAARKAAEWTHAVLTADNLAYLRSLPDRETRGDFLLVHGSPRDPIWEYVFIPAVAGACFRECAFPHYCLLGHSHIPLVFTEKADSLLPDYLLPTTGEVITLDEQRLIVNPGSVGQPRDGIPWASYIILDTEAKKVEYRRVEYDIAETQRLMRAIPDLPRSLSDRLSFGR